MLLGDNGDTFINKAQNTTMKSIKKFLSRLRGEQDISKLVKRGLKIGRNCQLSSCLIDPSHCFHITIGDNVVFGPHVHILAHDTSTKAHLGYTRVANVSIGNNVFIGARSIVLPGVHIGDNVIIGAGSVVTHDIPASCVALGVPAKVVKGLDDYLSIKRAEMKGENTFDESFTLRNPSFGPGHRKRLVEACDKYGQIYIE